MSLTSSGKSYAHFIWYIRINDFTVAVCNSPKRVNLFGDFSSSAQFFVFTGVFVFLYCIGVLILYVVYSDAYSNSVRASKADFIASVLIAVLWFIASAAWADGVQQLKTYTDPLNIIVQAQGADRQKSKPLTFPTYGGVNASLIFGFANIALWASSLWFIWKETSWSKRNDSLVETSNVSGADGSSI
ncbi:hypothetical protein P879_05487 [Paragonimus westermani]|uniref:MARVEL domain-containing protein n=1 Tax=Paragonimus westermani TaxID=34504 RepID=A0A8T0DL75_9TREM|nr:hypothetical protein P879_05487 [Paragonimus westermani]